MVEFPIMKYAFWMARSLDLLILTVTSILDHVLMIKSTFLIVELSFGGEIIWNPHSDDGLLLARLKNQSLDEEMDQIRKVRSCRVSDNIKTGKLK